MLAVGLGVTGASSYSSLRAGADGILETVFLDAIAVEGALETVLALEVVEEGVLEDATDGLVAEAEDVTVTDGFVGVTLGEPRTNDLEPATLLEEPERAIGEDEVEEGTFSGERALCRLASFFCNEERSREAVLDPGAGLLIEEAEEDAFEARSGEVEREADLEADLDAEREVVREVVRELMREPACEAGGVGSKPSRSALSKVISSVSVAFTLASTSCKTRFARVGAEMARCM